MLTDKSIVLRAPEPADIDLLYEWENNTLFWKVSGTLAPFSRHVLEHYILSASQDIHSARQVRFMIGLTSKEKTIGCIDLFDYDPLHRRAGVGILIADQTEQRNGYASSALELLIDYAFGNLKLNQLYCNVAEGNLASLNLFHKFGFQNSGVKKQWINEGNSWKDELFLQLLREDSSASE